jgi:hypothetical protein
MDTSYIPDPATVRRSAELDLSPATKFIKSPHSGLWHIGKRHDSRGARSGLILRVSYITSCSGKQLGGPWGQTERRELPDGASLCPKCQSIRAKATAADRK